MKAAKERAIQDKGGVPLEEGEKWLLTTKACHDLLNDRAERRRRLIAHEKKEDELKMVRRGRSTLPGDLVCEIMSDTMSHRLIRDDETGLGGKNLRQELLKKESEMGNLASVVMAANRFKSKSHKKKRIENDVPLYGYPTFTYMNEKEYHEKQSKNDDRDDMSSQFSGTTTSINDRSETRKEEEEEEERDGKEDSNHDEESSLKTERTHESIISKFQSAAHKGVSRKKLRLSRLRMILPVGDEEGQEAVFWEKVGVPRIIPGKEGEEDALKNKAKEPLNKSKKPQRRRNSIKSHGTTSDETLAQTKSKIRMNQEMGWRPGLLRKVDVVDEDPSGWLMRAREQRSVAKADSSLETLFWEKEGRPALPDPFAISDEVSKFLRLNVSEEEDEKKKKIKDNEEEEEEGEDSEEGETFGGGFKGTFKWVEESVLSGTTGGMSGESKSRPDGRVHHTMTTFPSCWSPKKGSAGSDWLPPGKSLFFMFGGRCFVQPPPPRRGDPSKGRYRPSPTKPTNELWSYTPQLNKWQNLTDYCTGKGAGPRSRHTTAIVRGGNESINLLVFGGLDLHNNNKNDLFILSLTTLGWTEVMLRGVPPPHGLGAACLTEAGKDLVVTKDKDVVAETDAERKNGIPASMGVWRLKIDCNPETAHSNRYVWLGLWSRAPRRLPSHGSGHTVTTLGRSQIVFGGLASKTGDVVSMALGTLKVLGSDGGYANPLLDSNSQERIQTTQEIIESKQRNRERRRERRRGREGDNGKEETHYSIHDDSEEDDIAMEQAKASTVSFEKQLEPLPRRIGKGAGAIAQRLIATPDPSRAIKYQHTAIGTKEEGRFRNPLRDGLQGGSLGNVPVKDVSKMGIRKLLCASDKKFYEEQLDYRPSSSSSSASSSAHSSSRKGMTYAPSSVGGSSLDDWLKMTEKVSENTRGHGGHNRGGEHENSEDESRGEMTYGGGGGQENSKEEIIVLHHESLPSRSDRQHMAPRFKDVPEQPYYDTSMTEEQEQQNRHKDRDIETHQTRMLSRESGVSRDSRRSGSSSSSSRTTQALNKNRSEYSPGGPWEPAEWVRPWARAGIKRLSDPPLRQYHAAVAVSKRHMVICGGELGGPLSDSVSEESEGKYRVSSGVYLLDLQTSEWSQLPVCNPVRRAGHALACVDGKLLSFGGRSAPLPATKPFPSDLLCLHYDG